MSWCDKAFRLWCNVIPISQTNQIQTVCPLLHQTHVICDLQRRCHSRSSTEASVASNGVKPALWSATLTWRLSPLCHFTQCRSRVVISMCLTQTCVFGRGLGLVMWNLAAVTCLRCDSALKAQLSEAGVRMNDSWPGVNISQVKPRAPTAAHPPSVDSWQRII